MQCPPCVVVLTYARPDSLALLLDDLEREAPADGLDVRIYDDATPSPDPALAARIRGLGWRYRRAAVNHGKTEWWRWWNTILADLRKSPAPLTYVFNDDMRLCRSFFERSSELWDSIDDPLKASLYLHLSSGRSELGGTCWTPVRATRAGRVVHCGWVDCAAFMCDRRLFDALEWRLHAIDARRWRNHRTLSSGVGQQISIRAHRLGLRLYRVAESLTVHDGSPSLMSREARQRWPMETVEFVDGAGAARACMRTRPHVFASVASVPQRERGLRSVVESLLPQVDVLGVYLNGYDHVPPFLDRPHVVVARSQEHGVRADGGKFFWTGTTQGYQLVCDDDIAYPADYVEKLVAGIERHGRRAVVGFHGCVLRSPIVDYHVSRRLLHFSRSLGADTAVHVLGTGVAGFHSSAIRFGAERVEPGMADLSFALAGQQQRVPFVCLRRPERWLVDLPAFRDDSIYAHARRAARSGTGPSRETLAARRHEPWRLHSSAGAPDSRPGITLRDAHRLPPRRRTSSAPLPLLRLAVAGPKRQATLVLPRDDHITEMVRSSGTYYERDLLDAIRARVRGGTFVDVGAHYGNHTAFFALECGADRVVAIEPNAAAVAGLLETVAENELGAVVVRRAAVHPAWRSVSVTPLPWRPPRGSTVRANSGRMGIRPSVDDRAAAPAAPLDELLASEREIRAVKIDTAGAGAQILASGARLLRRDRPLVAVDASTAAEQHALRAVLTRLGYQQVGRYCWSPTWLWAAAS